LIRDAQRVVEGIEALVRIHNAKRKISTNTRLARSLAAAHDSGFDAVDGCSTGSQVP
jgi:hypothetical protein